MMQILIGSSGKSTVSDETGEAVTVVVRIRVGDDDLCFVAPPPPGSGPRRRYSTAETAIIALWGKCGMNKASVSAGDLISFLKQLPHYLS